MGLSCACKLLLALVVTAYVFSGTAEAWSWASVNSGGRSSGSSSDSHSDSNHSSGNGSTHKSHKTTQVAMATTTTRLHQNTQATKRLH
ncbi:unnamed protein product [Arabis nemorensis]|uniref:Uncharacterized protein n=1 Tax=Arabis nemorensis TaxID=586526 RepID=A0A565CMM5_9BRAS|nr:unnamed protein product [Arabis nemorensis]